MKNLILTLSILSIIGCKNSNNQIKNEQSKKNTLNISEIEEYLGNQAKKDSLHGVILIADKDQIILKKSYGFKDLNQSEKHTINGEIGLASMGKMFSALSIMKLNSQGKIDLDASLKKYLPGIQNKFLRDSITVRDLLSHRSGLGHYWDYTTDEEQQSLNKIFESIVQNSDIKKDGQFKYSNSGYIILGKIIEVVSETTYEDYVNKNIFKSLSMNNTSATSPDGANHSTLDDMYRFANALKKSRIVKEETLNQMIEKQPDVDYGLGFKVFHKNKSKVYGHTGGFFQDNTTLGVASALDIIDDKYTIIVLTNRNPRMGGSKARKYILDYLTSVKTD